MRCSHASRRCTDASGGQNDRRSHFLGNRRVSRLDRKNGDWSCDSVAKCYKKYFYNNKMEWKWQEIGFVGCALVSVFILSNTFDFSHKYLFIFTGIIGCGCLIAYSIINRIWPPFVTNVVLMVSLLRLVSKELRCRKSFSSSTRDDSIQF